MSMRDIFMAMALAGMNSSGVSDAQIASAVNAYLIKNPVPTYTLPIGGSELGGVKNGGNVTINIDGTMTAPGPSQNSYTLPVATADTLGGVKPASVTEDMTQSVGVDADGALWTIPGGGSGDVHTEILSFTTEEEVTELILEIDESYRDILSKYKVLELHARIQKSTTEEYTENGTCSVYLQGVHTSGSIFAQLEILNAVQCVPKTDVSYINYCDVYAFMPKGVLIPTVMGSLYTHMQNQNAGISAKSFAKFNPSGSAKFHLKVASSINMGVGSTFKLIAWGSIE